MTFQTYYLLFLSSKFKLMTSNVDYVPNDVLDYNIFRNDKFAICIKEYYWSGDLTTRRT